MSETAPGNVGEAKQVVNVHTNPTPTLAPMPAPSGDGILVAVRDGYSVKEFANREEGIRRHTFDDVRSYCAWLNRHASEHAKQVEILLAHLGVDAILNPRDAVPEIVSCTLRLDPTFAAWTEALGDPMSQKAFHELARGFRDSLADADQVLSALRTINVAKAGELKSEIDELGYTRMQVTTGNQELTATLPPELSITCPVFQGILNAAGNTETHLLEILVSIDIDGQVPIFNLSCPGLELVKNSARRGVASMLARDLDDDFLVGLGEIGRDTRLVLGQAIAGTVEDTDRAGE